jgi:acetyl-CoA acetyltransferase
METYGVTREQLAMTAVLMSRQASRHPGALTQKPHSLEKVLSAPRIAPVTGLLECARRADGAAAIIVASTRFIKEHGLAAHATAPVVVGGGEASGPLYPPPKISEDMFSCEEAANKAYESAQLGPRDIDFYGLYDCFPICFVRAVEAVGLAPKGGGGAWVQRMYEKSEANGGYLSPSDFPINTHGGLLSFGAPWETPAMYNIIEAVTQLNGKAGARQVPKARRALIYGNGGIFSASAVAILGNGSY